MPRIFFSGLNIMDQKTSFTVTAQIILSLSTVDIVADNQPQKLNTDMMSDTYLLHGAHHASLDSSHLNCWSIHQNKDVNTKSKI